MRGKYRVSSKIAQVLSFTEPAQVQRNSAGTGREVVKRAVERGWSQMMQLTRNSGRIEEKQLSFEICLSSLQTQDRFPLTPLAG